MELEKTKLSRIAPIVKIIRSLRQTRFVFGRSIDFLSNLFLILPTEIIEALNGLSVRCFDFLEETREMIPSGNLDEISVDSRDCLKRSILLINHFAIEIRWLNHNGESKRVFAYGRSTSFAHWSIGFGIFNSKAAWVHSGLLPSSSSSSSFTEAI